MLGRTRVNCFGLSGALAIAIVGAACGSDEAAQPVELASLATETHSGGLNQAPVIRDLRIEPAGEPAWLRSNFAQSIKRMPVSVSVGSDG